MLTEALSQHKQQPAELNGSLVGRLLDLKALESVDVMEKAYKQGPMDEMVCGSWARVQIELGLATADDFTEEELQHEVPEWMAPINEMAESLKSLSEQQNLETSRSAPKQVSEAASNPSTIDDYASAIALQRQLSKSTPFTVRPGKPLLKLMKSRGTPMSAERDYVVEKVIYSGDEGGITCMLQGSITDDEVVGASLTHLVVDASHPLSDRIKTYQRDRIRRLRLQDQKGFAALASQTKAKKKKKRGGGFGR